MNFFRSILFPKLLQKLALLTLSSIKVQAARDEMQWGEESPPPLLVKIAPDLSKEDLEDIAAVCIYASSFHFFSL